MSDFPKNGSIGALRLWLDANGLLCFLDGWNADALLGAKEEDVKTLVPGEAGMRLWGLLNTARSTGQKEPPVAEFEQLAQPITSRKRRWDAINPILLDEVQRSKKLDKSSISFASVTWSQLEFAFPLEQLNISPAQVPSDKLELLFDQLTGIHQLYGNVVSGKETKRLQFISPILNSICLLLPGVTISVEEDMKGVNVCASGRFEYVIHYKNKKVCIVVAKKDDLEQGQLQSLLGCEVIAEFEKCSVVYAIVTNYIEWLFFKNTDDVVYQDMLTLCVDHGLPDKSSVSKIANCIFGILTEIRDS